MAQWVSLPASLSSAFSTHLGEEKKHPPELSSDPQMYDTPTYGMQASLNNR